MENASASGYEVDLSKFARQGSLTISAARLANGLHPDESNWIPILSAVVDGHEYTLALEKINPEPLGSSAPKTEAEVALIEDQTRSITEISVHATFQDEYYGMFTWECEGSSIGNYIPEISIDPAAEIDRLARGVREGTIS